MSKTHTHKCDAPGCDRIIPRGKLMCGEHWFALPAPLRRAINENWRERRMGAWSECVLEARGWLAQSRAEK